MFQSFLDNHEQIYMIPAYPLFYFYPHWKTWKEELEGSWNWESLIEKFRTKHASVLDSRRIPGFNGLTALGESQDGYIRIDEDLFLSYLTHLLQDQPIHRHTFLMAIHYAYSLARSEDLKTKRALVYHIHDSDYLTQYLAEDVPDVLTVAMLRDPRPNIEARYRGSFVNVDHAKLNKTDALIYRKRAYHNTCLHVFNGLDKLRELPSQRVRAIKHEDLGHNLETVMRSVSDYLGIEYSPVMREITFDGRAWWGDQIYDMEPLNVVSPRVLSQNWKETISKVDWFVIEGVMFDYLQRYGYTTFKYRTDSVLERVALVLAILLPTRIERKISWFYLNPLTHLRFLRAARDESTGRVELKDYAWNATYLYKNAYIDLELWRPRWYVSFLSLGQMMANPRRWRWLARAVSHLSKWTYVFATYGRFWWAILSYPAAIVRRWRLFYSILSRRLREDNFLPEMLG